jgi:hypothetical protein
MVMTNFRAAHKGGPTAPINVTLQRIESRNALTGASLQKGCKYVGFSPSARLGRLRHKFAVIAFS